MNTKADKKEVARDWFSTIIKVLTFIFSLIGYGSRGREWVKSVLGGEWQLGFFEGVIIAIVIFGLVKKYGSIIDEAVLGLRELGRRRKDQTTKE